MERPHEDRSDRRRGRGTKPGRGLNIGPNALKALRLYGGFPLVDPMAVSLPWKRWEIVLTNGTRLIDLDMTRIAVDQLARCRMSISRRGPGGEKRRPSAADRRIRPGLVREPRPGRQRPVTTQLGIRRTRLERAAHPPAAVRAHARAVPGCWRAIGGRQFRSAADPAKPARRWRVCVPAKVGGVACWLLPLAALHVMRPRLKGSSEHAACPMRAPRTGSSGEFSASL